MRRLLAILVSLLLLAAACGSSSDEADTRTAGAAEPPATSTTAPVEQDPSTTTTTEPQLAAFEVLPESGPVGTVFVASGSGCSGEAYIDVFLENVPSGPDDFTVESHPVAADGGEWSEELDSAGWPDWVPGSDPPQYEGLGSNAGLYRVSAKCMVGDGLGEVVFDYEDQLFTIEPGDRLPLNHQAPTKNAKNLRPNEQRSW